MADANPIIAVVTRDGFEESVHRGRVVGLGAGGSIVLGLGAVTEPVLPRSCAKPMQAVGMLRAGLDLTGAPLAIACASHDGTDAHLVLVRRILADAGLDVGALANTPLLALEPRAAAVQLLAGGPDRAHHNCSGKHAAMLATCVATGWPVEGYLARTHPLQQALVTAVEDLAGEAAVHLATDGCGAPIAALSLVGLAHAFARIGSAPAATPEGGVAAAVRAHPGVVGGEARGVTRLLRAVPDLVAKDGAEGCFAAALPDGRAVAVKVDDGGDRAALPVMVAALRALGVDTPALAALAEVPVLGHGRAVGAVRAVDVASAARRRPQ